MKDYVSIQYLRGLAALMVVVFHLGPALARLGYAGAWPVGLSAGVHIFFVISGFVMWLTTRTRDIGPLAFWWKRVTRIVPLYWLVTSVMLAIILIAPAVMRTSIFSLPHVLASYAFLPFRNPGQPAMEPLVFAGWTLNYEMVFYLIFGLFLLTRNHALRLAGTVALLGAAVVAGAVFRPPHLSVFGFYSDTIVLEFAFGMVLSEITMRRGAAGLVGRRPGIACVIGGLALLFLPFNPVIPWAVSYGVPALIVVLGALSIEMDGGVDEYPLAHRLGDASYSLYLTQLISMAAFLAVWRALHLPTSPAGLVVFAVLDVVLAVLASLACYYLVERPMIALFRSRQP